jgi:hypothetical protein
VFVLMCANNQFLMMLADYINNYDQSSISTLIDQESIYVLAKKHNLTPILAAISNKYSFIFNEKIQKILKIDLALAVSQSIIWDNLYDELSECFSNNKIINIVVKGPIIKKCYPDPELRTMGDIDFVIHRDTIQKARKIIEEIGFKLVNLSIDEYKYERNGKQIELHEDLLSDDLGTGINYKEAMQSLFDNTDDSMTYSKKLTNEWHLVYLLLHIAHHLYYEGCGIRQIMDVALWIKNTKLDMAKVKEILEEMQLSRFANNIYYLCNKWFYINVDYYDDICEELEDYILNGGVFGNKENRRSNTIIRDGIHSKNRLKPVLKKIFFSSKEASALVPWFNKKKKWILPLAWVYRWTFKFIESPQKLIEYIKLLFTDKRNEEIDEEYRMLQKLGFYSQK